MRGALSSIKELPPSTAILKLHAAPKERHEAPLPQMIEWKMPNIYAGNKTQY